ALHPDAPRTLWVWARRDERAAAPDETERALFAAGLAERLELEPFTTDDLARFAAARLQEPAPQPLLDWLGARAGGHPGLATALLREAAAKGALRESDAGLWVDDRALAALELPDDFEASLLRLHDALPEPERALAGALAVIGRAIEPARAIAIAHDAWPALDL